MAKYQKGDRITGRTPGLRDESPPYHIIGGHVPYEKPLTVKRVVKNGVVTKEAGFVHRNNILGKVEGDLI